MADDTHPFISEAIDHSPGWSGDDLPTMFKRTAVALALAAPSARVAIIKSVERAMNEDDGVPLRQKAQLLNLHRELSDSHDKLTAANR